VTSNLPHTLGLAALLLFSEAALAIDPSTLRHNFDFDWRFHPGEAPGASAQVFPDGDWRELNVPHDYSREGDFSETNASCTAFLPGGIGWYRKTFMAPSDWSNQLVSVQFDGVSERSEVWLNGHSLGERPYAYSTFDCSLTAWLHFGGTNVIAVRCDPERADSRWYPGSGIDRHVWLIVTGKIHVARYGIYLTTPEVTAQEAQVKVQTRIQNENHEACNLHLITEIIDPHGKKISTLDHGDNIDAGGAGEYTQTAEIASPELWSPDSPALYTAVSTIQAAGKVVDRRETKFGIRSIRFDAQAGFLLNGQVLKIKGVCLHDDAGALGSAVPDQVLERRLRLLKGIGCNAIRCSHNPKASEFYDLCDRLGLLVMDEAFDEWTCAKSKWIHGWNVGEPSHQPGYSAFFQEWADRDLRDMVQRDRNHPSVILWSIGNEIDYPGDPFSYPTDKNYDSNKPSATTLVPIARRLIADVRECDDTRPVTAALANLPASDATGLAGLLDAVGVNYQIDSGSADLACYQDRKFFFSETGYGVDYAELCATNPRVAGQFLWVGFDYLGEAKKWPERGWDDGLFDTCGFEKPRAYFRESLWSETPMVYIGVRSRAADHGAKSWQGDFGWQPMRSDWNWADDPRPELPVEVYSNCKTVELFLNGKSLGKKTLAEGLDRIRRWRVHFEPGELKAVGTGSGKKVVYRLVTAGKPARLDLISDQTRLAANGEDVAQIEIRLVDAKGILVSDRDVVCSVQVAGAGRLLALDNGNQNDLTPATADSRQLHDGRAVAIMQSRRQGGPITVKVTAPGLPEAELRLQAD
jgi:beta-galactosidase